MIYVRDAIKKYSEEILNNTISSCNVCGFNTFKALGSGNIEGTVLVIGDYPDMSLLSRRKNIDALGEDIDSLEGSFLQNISQVFSLDINEFYFIHAVNCFCMDQQTKKYRPPRSNEINNCSVYVKHVVELMHPALIILMGNIALNIFKKESMSKAHGQWVNAYTLPAMPVYSPWYIQSLLGRVTETRRQQLIRDMWDDMGHAFEFLKKNYPNAKIFLNKESEE